MKITVQLTPNEKSVLESTYGRLITSGVGYSPRQLESIKALTAQEKKFFVGKNFVSSHFFVQTFYKIRGSLSPIKFNAAVNNMLKENETLRANFCDLGTRTVKVIHSKGITKPEIIFRNFMEVDKNELDDKFRKILEADMRRDCDLRHDPLIRFAVYRTGADDFAVLVTLAQIVADSFNAEKFFCDVLGIESELNLKQNPPDLPQKNQEAIRDYWAKLLYNAPPLISLPYEKESVGAYSQQVFHTTIDADILSDLRGNAQSNRLMLTSILQSAWGFMLQLTSKRNDCLFCQILSNGNAEENSSFNLVPVRLVGERNLTVEQIVSKQFRQLVISQPYSRVDWLTLEDLMGHRKKLFDHFISFKEFQASEMNYVDTVVENHWKIVSRNSWDAQGMKLGVYFHYSEKNLSVSFLYDKKKFLAYGIERLCAIYKSVLKQMLVDWNAKYDDFMERLANRIVISLETEAKAYEEDARRLRNFISQLAVLQGRYSGSIKLFESKAKFVTYYEGDRISGNILDNNFLFVVSGKIARNVDTGDGWYNPLDIIGKNSFVNPLNLIEKPRLTLSAEVLTEQAEFMIIPRNTFLEIIRYNPEITLSILTFTLEQMERYQMLWLQS